MNNNKLIGGTLLIASMSLGSGMLALPIILTQVGFVGAAIWLLLFWAFMTYSSFLILEANLWFPEGTNFISMTKNTLGIWGQILVWVFNIAITYCVLAAYVAGGGDMLQSLLRKIHIHFPLWSTELIFLVMMASIIALGICIVDYINRGLIFIKLIVFFLLILSFLPYFKETSLTKWKVILPVEVLGVLATCYAFATIIPSLRTYYQSDIKRLRLTLWMSTLLQLFCYLIWIGVVFSVLLNIAPNKLNLIAHSPHALSDLMGAIKDNTQAKLVIAISNTFTIVCLFTSFLGVSLGFIDFLSDGLKIKKQNMGRIWLYSVAFLPPLILDYFFKDIFIRGLHYAGIGVVFIMAVLPALIVWRGRYQKLVPFEYQTSGGKFALILVILTGLTLMLLGLIYA